MERACCGSSCGGCLAAEGVSTRIQHLVCVCLCCGCVLWLIMWGLSHGRGGFNTHSAPGVCLCACAAGVCVDHAAEKAKAALLIKGPLLLLKPIAMDCYSAVTCTRGTWLPYLLFENLHCFQLACQRPVCLWASATIKHDFR